MRTPSDRQVDVFIGGLLRVGVLASAALVLAGAAIALVQGGTPAGVDAFGAFPASITELRSVGAVFRDALRGSGRGVIQLGVLVLIATPIARVVLSVVAFAVQRDRTYVGITLVVLSVLAFSLFGSAPLEGETRSAAGLAAGSDAAPSAPKRATPLEKTAARP